MTDFNLNIFDLLISLYRKLYFKFFIILSIFIYIFKNYCYIHYINNKLKVCVCTVGKLENRYIIEYINHYHNYKFDKIFIYDNNEKYGEKFEDVINAYIKKGFVQIINFRGRKCIQRRAINDCYRKNFNYYDWILFGDIDEFIFLKYYKNIKVFLYKKRFNKCQSIQFNWVMHTDNNQIYYNNKSLSERFPEKGKSLKTSIDVKSIVKGKINMNFTSIHYLSGKLISCDVFGNIKKKFYFNKNRYYKKNYIDHYYTKSTEEFITKIKRGSVGTGIIRYGIIDNYFELNKITKEKIDYIEKEMSTNLTKYQHLIKNDNLRRWLKLKEDFKNTKKNIT